MDKLKGMASKMGGGGSGEQKPAAGGEQQDYVDKGEFFLKTLISLSLSICNSYSYREEVDQCAHLCLEPPPFRPRLCLLALTPD